jgi:aspartokinase/homoserine dehydrogenase 1
MLVMKFGGTSVGSGERICRVARIALDLRDREPVLVTSAMSGITDALLALAEALSHGDQAAGEAKLTDIEQRHLEAARQIDPAGDWADMAAHLAALRELAASGAIADPMVLRDAIAAFGERLAVVLVARAISLADPASPGWYAGDANRIVQPLIATDDQFGEATPDLAGTQRLARTAHAAMPTGAMLVAPGFIGQAPGGQTTTLGRGGSDYSATLLAAALGADACWIYTDVDGIFTADPRVVPEAQALPVISFAAAGRLALCGAKVLHPRSVAPAARAGCELRVKNTFRPERDGTLLVATSEATRGMPLAVAGRRNLAALRLMGPGLAEIPNLFARLCQTVAEADGEIVLAAQPVPGHDPQIIIPANHAASASAALRREFAREMAQGQVQAIESQADLALCTVVGDDLAPGALAQAVRAFAAERIVPLSQSAAPEALTFIIPVAGLDRLTRRLHQDCILPALREVQQRHTRPYADGQWAAGSRPSRRRRISAPEH